MGEKIATRAAYGKALVELAEKYPDQYAFKYTTLDYVRTYEEFREDVDNFARALISLGVRAGMNHLNGEQALAYSRIRKLDMDAMQQATAATRRQRAAEIADCEQMIREWLRENVANLLKQRQVPTQIG